MKRTRSIQASIRLFCIFFSVFCFLALFSICFLLIRQKLHEELSFTEIELESYVEAFQNELDAQAAFNLEYLTNDSDVNVLSLNRYPGPSRVPLIYSVTQVLARRSNHYCINIMYDRLTDQIFTTPLPFPSLDRSLDDSVVLRTIISFSSSLDESQRHCWTLFSFNGTNYLILCSQKNRLLLTTVISVEDYFGNLPGLSGNSDVRMLLTNGEDILFGDRPGFDEETTDFVLSASQKDGGLSYSHGKLLYSHRISRPDLGLHLCKLFPVSVFMRDFLPILTVSLVLLCVFLALAELSRRYLIRFLVFPLQEIEALSKTAEEKQSFTPAQTELPKEYEEIRNSLYALVEKLEKEQRERQDYISAKEHALLQYYQLQTRSHFFINCLKSLYSMLELHREEQMKEMIIAFSRHLRNTFRNSLQLIPLSQELEEVSAYHTILFLDDTRPTLLNVSIPDTLTDVLVPPLVIQSFLENTYKHSVPGESMIVFTVQADTVWEDGKEYLQLHLSDNGSGYAQDRLAELNSPITGSFDTDNVGINNLKRRINLPFHGEGRTAFVNLPSGGACAIISFPALRGTGKEGVSQ